MSSTARRRWFGAAVLTTALAMLVCGQTVLRGKLGGTAFVAYWCLCFGLTFLAMIVALLDARALQRRMRHEQRDLLESTLAEIQREAANRKGQSPPKQGT